MESEQVESSNNNLSSAPSSKRKRYDVWECFKEVVIDNVKYAYCPCGERFISGKGTTTLWNHIKFRCKNRTETHMTVSTSFSQDVSRKDLAKMIILHEYPMSIVDHVGFRNFVRGLRPEFVMVSRNTIRKDILGIFMEEKVKNLELLSRIDRIALTTDMWTAKTTKRGYMSITAHFIDDSWVLQNRILEFVYVPAPHNSETLLKVLIDCLFDWNINTKVSAITVDNATTNDSMMDKIVDRISRSSLLLRGKFIHIRCCCHIINLIVKDGMEVIDDGIKRIRFCCLFWTSNQSRKEKFENMVRQLNLLLKALETDVRTRWSSAYFMLRSALPYKEVFNKLKGERNFNCLPSADDWNLAAELCEKLKLFYSITELFSGTTYPTSNSYFVKVCKIKLSLDQWVGSCSEMVMTMASKMLDKYNKYWGQCHVLMGVACVLDPRYKMKMVEYYYKKIFSGEEVDLEIQKVKQCCEELFLEYQSSFGRETIATTSIPLDDDMLIDDELLGFDEYLDSTANDIIQTDLDRYLEKPPLQRELRNKFDILGWWNTEGANYPILRKMAKDILAIPVSTVASESSFSTSGRLLGPHRSRLQPSMVEALMCSQSWLWNDHRADDQRVLIIENTRLVGWDTHGFHTMDASRAISSSPQPPILPRFPGTPHPPTVFDVEEDIDEPTVVSASLVAP